MIGPLSYIGGKRSLAKRVSEMLPAHTTYAEPFVGGGQVFFRKAPSKVEAVNDIDGELIGFYRVCQQHYEELLRYCHFLLVSRKWYDILKSTDPAGLTDIQRAARYLYVLKNSYAGLVRNPSYIWHVVQPPGFNLKSLPQLIENVHKRLERVQIENLPYQEVIRRFDRPATLFYCDPPYWGRKLYRFNFEPADFERMAEILGKIRGKFILSLNDVPEVRTLFRRFRIQGVELPYTAQKSSGRRYREVLITNFKP